MNFPSEPEAANPSEARSVADVTATSHGMTDEGNEAWQFEYGANSGPATAGAGARRATPGGEGLISNFFYATNLREVLSEFASQTGRTIMVDESVQGVVTADFQDVPLEDALRMVLSVGDYVYREMDDGFILVGSADPESPSFPQLAEREIIRLEHVSPGVATKYLPSNLSKYVTFEENNQKVLVQAPRSKLTETVQILRDLDQQPDQIMLEARIVVLESLSLLDLGLQWDWPQAQFGGFTNSETYPTWPWGLQIGYTPGQEFTGALLTTLNLLSSTDQAVVLANPQVMALERETATVSVTTEEYFEILTRGFYADSELEKIEAGTTLEITPRMAQENHIDLNMKIEVSDVIARGENNLPVVTRRTAQSHVVVEDGGTAVVAGLVDNRTRLGKERVPGISRVPLLGHLFQNDIDQTTKRQVAIFVTPRRVRSAVEEPRPGRSLSPVPLRGEDFQQELLEVLQTRKGDQS